jgi:hypothetical protein
MDKLKTANLYRSELLPISGKLVERYNQCLALLGLSPTKLKSFSIDGIGWSPEISEKLKNPHYLNNSGANPHAIIITPQQKNKPVYVPFHSFDRDIMKQVFRIHGERINDITRDCAICVDLDQYIDAFYEPLDVLKYQNINIGFRLINDLDKAQVRQMQLIKTFKEGNNFIDEDLHMQLLGMARKYGDLRERDLDMQELQFTTDSFYTRAFGGVYVLRDFISPIVVFDNEKWYKEAIKDTIYDVFIYHIKQPELVEKLRDYMIIDYDLEKVVKTERYDRIKKHIFANTLKNTKNPIKDILNDKVLFKAYLNKIDIEARKRVMGVERYLEKLEVSNEYKISDLIDDDILIAMHEPHSSLMVKHQDLIWKLLVNIAPYDPLHLYWYDKEEFYKLYQTWDESYQDWVIGYIRNKV